MFRPRPNATLAQPRAHPPGAQTIDRLRQSRHVGDFARDFDDIAQAAKSRAAMRNISAA